MTMRNGTRLAALDLGSNSFRLEIGQYEGGQIEHVKYLKETVRQGAGLVRPLRLAVPALRLATDRRRSADLRRGHPELSAGAFRPARPGRQGG